MKPDASRFVTTAYQVALFLRETDIGSFNKNFGNLFQLNEFKDGDQIVLPSFFRIVTEGGGVVVQLINGKLDIFFNSGSDDKDLSKEQGIIDRVVALTRAILDKLEITTVHRMGFLAHTHYPVQDFNEAIALVNGTMLCPPVATRLSGFVMNLTFPCKSNVTDKKCNRYFETGYGEKKVVTEDTSKDVKAYVLTSDVNTHQSEDVNFSKDEIISFIKEAWPLTQPSSALAYLWTE